MNRAYFQSSIAEFVQIPNERILGALASNHEHSLELLQRDAWIDQISHLKLAVGELRTGHIFVEFAIPRMGKRADVVILNCGRVLVGHMVKSLPFL